MGVFGRSMEKEAGGFCLPLLDYRKEVLSPGNYHRSFRQSVGNVKYTVRHAESGVSRQCPG